MSRSDGLDELLEDELTRAAAQIQGDDGLTRTLVEGSVTRLRRHQRRRVMAAAATTSLAVLATGLVGWQLQSGSGNAGPAMHVPDSISVPTVAQTYTVRGTYSSSFTHYAWAKSLPVVGAPRSAYITGDRFVVDGTGDQLVVDGHVINLDPTVTTELGPALPGGWLARQSRDDDDRARPHTRYGLLDPVGKFHPFAFVRTPGSGHLTSGWAASPDGSRVAYGGGIVDVATGNRVRYLPRDASYINAWTTAGIAYWDGQSHDMIWRPGSLPQRTPWHFVSATQATLQDHRCTRYGVLDSAGIVRPVSTVCGTWSLMVSPGGYAVTSTGVVIELSTGARLGSIPVSPPVDGFTSAMCCGFNWSQDDHLIAQIAGVPLPDTPSILVSCDVSTGRLRCGRVES